MDTLLAKLQKAIPGLVFAPGTTFLWSPKSGHVMYRVSAPDDTIARWSLLHEVGHALLQHHSYKSDFELLQMEVAAWEMAESIAPDFGETIDEEHVQDCLDTYRDWLYQRSTCPTCTSCSLQTDSRTYECFNCGTVWHVSTSRLCRPYRRRAATARK